MRRPFATAFFCALGLGLLASPTHAQQADKPIVLQVQEVPADPAAKPDQDPAATDPTETVAPASSARKPLEPPKRKRYTVAILQVLDKVTAETLKFEATVNKPVRYKSLIVTARTCETSASDEPVRDAFVNLQIDSVPVVLEGKATVPGRQLFKGWMFASTPGLNAFQHPTYDLWVITCKTSAPAA
jgi:hypothetical protein